LYKTGIAVGDYPVDHHHAQYPGKVPPIPFPQIPSYNIPMGAVISPTIDNLLICDKGISVSNIVNGTTRLQPVVLLTGQAVGIMAAECIHQHIQPKQIDIRSIQNALLNNNCYIMPFCDIDPTDPAWKSVQIMGALGLMKGHGVSEGWSNKTYYYPDSLMKEKEFIKNVNDLFQQKIVPETTDELSYITDKKLQHITNQINNYLASEHKIKIKQQVKVDATSVEKIISKKEIAVLFLKEVNTDVFKINFSGDLLIR
jgi:hypothetical protein